MLLKRLLKVSVTAMALLAATGCSTVMHASAPATQQGNEYVVGSKSGTRVIWLCPTTKAVGECRQVEVQE